MRLMVYVFICSSVLSTSVIAGSEQLTPTAVGCHPNGICYIIVSPPAVNTTCPQKTQIRFDISLPGSEAQYSAALSAVMSGKDVAVNLTDNCLSDFPVPDWLHVIK